MYYDIYKSRFCKIILVGDENGLSYVNLQTGKEKKKFQISKKWLKNEKFFDDVKKQLKEYFEGKRQIFDLKLNPTGTDFQKKVWRELGKISYGKTCTYKDIAINLNKPKASRAIGGTVGKNPFSLILPCHRVIGSNGKLTGFAHGLEIKKRLLEHEKIVQVFTQLSAYYGKQKWWSADSPFEIMVGAILTQNTTWKNVEKTLDKLKPNLSPQFIQEIPVDKLAELIRSSGYYRQKTLRLKALNQWFAKYVFDLEKVKSISGEILRDELLAINGVGGETADSILVYVLEKPFFVIDAYTRRLFTRIGIDVPKNYDDFRNLLENSVTKDFRVYAELHGLIVKHAKQFCLKTPKCERCPLVKICEKRGV